MLLRVTLGVAVAGLGCVEQTPDSPTEEDLRVIAANLLKEAPSPKFPVHAELGDKVVYLGLDTEGSATAGGRLTLVHYWKVKKPIGAGWKIFVHLNGEGRRGYVNADHAPVKGRYPVPSWKAGDIIRDEHVVTVPRTWTVDRIEIYTGIWRGSDRLPVTKGPSDGQNRVLAARLPLGKSDAASPKTAGKRYFARKAQAAITVDGKLEEEDWRHAPLSGPFLDTLTGAGAPVRTEAKALWDDAHLYVAFVAEDRDIASKLTAHDDRLWTADVVEMFIDGDADGKDYVELQVSPAGITFDSYLPAARQNQNDWESGMKAAVQIDGTLNRPGDQDRSWTVELALPLAAVKGKATDRAIQLPGEAGASWRINWYRLDGSGKDQKGYGWSPPLVGDFHTPDRFGHLRFVDAARAPRLGRATLDALRQAEQGRLLRHKSTAKPGPTAAE